MLFVYDHPRVDKSNMPLRSIISTMNASCYKFAEYLVKLLRSFHGKLAANSLKDAFQFSKEMDQLNISDRFMISFIKCSSSMSIPL